VEAGKTVSLRPLNLKLTTQSAANILGVPRPFLIRLLELNRIPHHMEAFKHFLFLDDLLVYKAERDRARHEAIRQLAMDDRQAGTYDRVILPEGGRDE